MFGGMKNFSFYFQADTKMTHKKKPKTIIKDTGKGKNKVQFTLQQAKKAQKWSRCIALLFLQPQH
jgi:hypothetical protein